MSYNAEDYTYDVPMEGRDLKPVESSKVANLAACFASNQTR